jgi:hypothetical protein
MTTTLNLPYLIVNDAESDHAALKLGDLQQKQHEGITLTDSEVEFMAVLTTAIIDYQIGKACINAKL